jgi:hypothetical protein
MSTIGTVSFSAIGDLVEHDKHFDIRFLVACRTPKSGIAAGVLEPAGSFPDIRNPFGRIVGSSKLSTPGISCVITLTVTGVCCVVNRYTIALARGVRPSTRTPAAAAPPPQIGWTN